MYYAPLSSIVIAPLHVLVLSWGNMPIDQRAIEVTVEHSDVITRTTEALNCYVPVLSLAAA